MVAGDLNEEAGEQEREHDVGKNLRAGTPDLLPVPHDGAGAVRPVRESGSQAAFRSAMGVSPAPRAMPVRDRRSAAARA